MNGTAIMTAVGVAPPKYRPEGATITEGEYRLIDPNYGLSESRLNAGWMTGVLQEVDELAQLPAGWDSYGADPPEPNLVATARRLIELIADERLPAPAVVTATRMGGIQFEWGSHDGVYFEVECAAPDEVEYYFVDSRRGVEEEGRLPILHADSRQEIFDFIRCANHDF